MDSERLKVMEALKSPSLTGEPSTPCPTRKCGILVLVLLSYACYYVLIFEIGLSILSKISECYVCLSTMCCVDPLARHHRLHYALLSRT